MRRESYRWMVSAVLVSLAFAFLLGLIVFLYNLIPNAMHSAETGWTDFTPSQWDAMRRWYLTLLGAGVIIIFTIFYRRRSRYDQ